MIVSVCADKGAPGVTTLTTVLGLVWPTERIVLEADVSGADLPFRLQDQAGALLDPRPLASVLALATDVRGPQLQHDLRRYTQPTALGVPVVPGALSAEAFYGMAGLWPQVASALTGWPGTVLADLGRLQPGDPATPVATMSTAVLLLARADVEGLYHLRERVSELAATVGRPTLDRSPLGVVLRARAGNEGKTAVQAVRQMLESIGSPAPVLGVFAEDGAAVEALRGRQLTRKLLNSDLLRSTRTLAEAVIIQWPQLAAPIAVAASSAPLAAEPQQAPPVNEPAPEVPVEVAAEAAAVPLTPLGAAQVPSSAGWGRLAGLRRNPVPQSAQQSETGQVST